MKNSKNFDIGDFSRIQIQASYVELKRDDPENVNDPHVHPECEIYINLSGDVSFMVEKRIYSVMPGNIVISKPYEYHHCIYHSDKLHRHFWILISLPKSEEAKLLFSKFLDRAAGENNLLSLPKEKQNELISVASRLSEENLCESEKYALFFSLLHLINTAESINSNRKSYPEEIDKVIEFIDKNFQDASISVERIAKVAGLSVNTLERHFKNFLSITPHEYLKKKRLANAAELLYLGKTVSESSELSGFSDYSHFISLFKTAYGITPLKYKKAAANKN